MAPPFKTRAPRSYSFKKDELAILRDAKQSWAESGDKHSGTALKDATEKLVANYKEGHNSQIDPDVEVKLKNAVKRWVLLNCRPPRKIDRKGTKARSWRQVAYLLNKTEVDRRTDALVQKEGGTRFDHHQTALTRFCSKLSAKKRAEYNLTARIWNNTGPPDDVKRQ